MTHVKAPTTTTLDCFTWSNLPHTDLEAHGRSFRLAFHENQRTPYLQTHIDDILKCFGISKEDQHNWSVTFSVDDNLFATDGENHRFEDGSYLERNYSLDLLGSSPYFHGKTPCTNKNRNKCELCYKYSCPDCGTRFNTYWCPPCRNAGKLEELFY